MRRSRINEVTLQNLYLALCKHSLLFGNYITPHYITGLPFIILNGEPFIIWFPVWNHIININKVKHDNCFWSSYTSLYLQSGINVLSACHFTYSTKTQAEQNFRKSIIISYRVNALQLNFLDLLCHHILSSHKSLSSN